MHYEKVAFTGFVMEMFTFLDGKGGQTCFRFCFMSRNNGLEHFPRLFCGCRAGARH
jgi:hypothetical protein